MVSLASLCTNGHSSNTKCASQGTCLSFGPTKELAKKIPRELTQPSSTCPSFYTALFRQLVNLLAITALLLHYNLRINVGP